MEASATITDRLKTRFDHLVVRMRTALDLPSRSEMLELTTRLEELDRRIAALATERVASMTAKVPALPEAASIEAAPAPSPVDAAPAPVPVAAEAPAPTPTVAADANSEPARPGKPRKR